MRICDWSSDVCSSDLHRMDCALGLAAGTPGAEAAFPQLVHDGFAEDRASTVAGAQEEHVVGLVGVDRVGHGSTSGFAVEFAEQFGTHFRDALTAVLHQEGEQ